MNGFPTFCHVERNSLLAVARNISHCSHVNRLYFGDNLKWLSDRKEFPDASVDLVYLDPPFNSNADYNVLFREPTGQVSQAQFHAFTDTSSLADAALADWLRKLNPYYASEREYVESKAALAQKKQGAY